jgi:mono/diheme cytochrome c family protein
MHDTRQQLRRTRRNILGLVVATSAAIALALPISAHAGQRESSAAPDGAELFKAYCASCHGTAATGHGPAAPTLRHVPPDLTLLSKKNGGMFPAARVHRIIEGRDVLSHGDRDMPVWGDAFGTTREGRSQETADARIAAIVRYLESIQQRTAH